MTPQEQRQTQNVEYSKDKWLGLFKKSVSKDQSMPREKKGGEKCIRV